MIAKDFTALVIISEFDDIFAKQASSDDISLALLTEKTYEEMFMIETTSSNDANGRQNRIIREDIVYEEIVANSIEKGIDKSKFPHNRPEKIHLNFLKRNWENKIFFAIYKIIRVFHVSIWFYFFPFIMLIWNYAQTIFETVKTEKT